MNKYKLRKHFALLASYAFLITMAIIVLFPLLVTVMSAFNTANTLYSRSLIPEQFSLTQNFIELFNRTEYISWYRNTFLLAASVSFISTIMVTISGFIYSRYRFRMKRPALLTLLIVQVAPANIGLIALFSMARALGIYSSPNSVLLTYGFMMLIFAAGQITMNTIIMKGYFDSIPKDLDESAKIDGATHVQVFRQILLPLAKPMVAVIAFFAFLAPVVDVLIPRFLIVSLHSRDTTLALGLNALIDNPRDQSFNLFAAGAILVALPPVILFFVLQKYIVSGLAAGGVKG